MFEVGRVCIKTAGREAGKVCCIVKKIDENFVMITGPRDLTRVKRRKCNILHLEPLPDKLKISEEAPDSAVFRAFQTSGILKKLNIEVPSKEEMERRRKLRAEKEKAKKAREERERKEREELEKRRKEEEEKERKRLEELKKKAEARKGPEKKKPEAGKGGKPEGKEKKTEARPKEGKRGK
jgi:large subunit ribosomal protein L14e